MLLHKDAVLLVFILPRVIQLEMLILGGLFKHLFRIPLAEAERLGRPYFAVPFDLVLLDDHYGLVLLVIDLWLDVIVSLLILMTVLLYQTAFLRVLINLRGRLGYDLRLFLACNLGSLLLQKLRMLAISILLLEEVLVVNLSRASLG